MLSRDPPAVLALLFALMIITGCDDASRPAPEPARVADSSARYPVNGATMPDAIAPPKVIAPVTPAPRPVEPLPEGASCMTSECHASYTTARQIHGPVTAGECFVCHDNDTGNHVYPMRRGPIETCTFCHRVSGVREHIHAPLADPKAGCTSCHDPHVSSAKFLLAAPTVEATCAKCHETPLKRFTHGPVAQGRCTLCHMPHEANNAKLLRGGEGNQHCFMCHEDLKLAMTNAPHTHKPAAEACTTCHDPHASDFPFELSAPIKDSCFACHKDLEKTITAASSSHEAVFTGDQCANCHDPHAAGRDHLLKNRVDHLCMQCHDKEIAIKSGRTIPDMRPQIADRKFLHGPVKTGQCDACHNAHGATHSRLLRESFTEAFYADFDESIYALCFTCHDKALVQEPATRTLTGFRNGDVNLHYIHVHKDRKGRTCRTCHAIHGSDLPNHMATDVPFEGSNWAMPIQFKQTPTGGSCSPGCHEPYTYRRDKEEGGS